MVRNTEIVHFKPYSDEYGYLVPVEAEETIPFKINRVYYIYEVDKGIRRGFHSHKALHQVLVCVHGSVKILIDDSYGQEVVELNDPSKGLYIGPMVWREMYDFSEGAVLLVLASEHYRVEDYIRSHNDFVAQARKYFNE